tara:strand:- start:301 stop:504 length:204 start_codon:yes stop_codon:yes gene_type:complete
MASLNEAFTFPLTSNTVIDKEQTHLNVTGRGNYLPLSKTANMYKQTTKTISDLKMYNYSLKEQKPLK